MLNKEISELLKSKVCKADTLGELAILLCTLIDAITEPEPAKPDPWNGWTPETLLAELREANLYNPIESPANTFLALGWYNACDDIERIVDCVYDKLNKRR